MDSLLDGVPQTIAHVLESHNWRRRKHLVDKVFAPDAVFWHPLFIVKGRQEIFGIYQLWGASNMKINVTYDRVVPDDKHKTVVVDLLETVRMWWVPLTWIGVPQHIVLHTVFEVDQTPEGYIYTHQEDHTLFLESLLYHNPYLTFGFNYPLRNFLSPALGSLAAACGSFLHNQYGSHSKLVNHHSARIGMLDIEQSCPQALEIMYCGSDADRLRALHTYTEDTTFWHPFLSVQGKQAVLEVSRLWWFLTSHLEVDTKRVVVSHRQDIMLIDTERRFRPLIWPSFLPPIVLWIHVVLHLVDAPDANQGKLISRHEDHVMWEESLLLRNLGPFSIIFRDNIRRFQGIVMSIAGNIVYALLSWLDLPKDSNVVSEGR